MASWDANCGTWDRLKLIVELLKLIYQDVEIPFSEKIMNSTPHKAPGAVASHISPAPAEDLIAKELLTYEVAGDGNWFRMRFTCTNGKPGSLSLPTECLNALIMTLPRMMTQALSARYGDDRLRLVYPAEAVRLETSPDPNTFIMTLVTPDGFAVSFSLNGQQLRTLSQASRGRACAST
jgi:hypothetical protein